MNRTEPISASKRASAAVALIRTEPSREAVFEAVARALDLANWKEFISAGADVALKPNLGWDKLIPGAISAPWVVEGVIIAIKSYVGSITVVESDQVVVDLRNAIRITRIDEVCKRQGTQWLNMSDGKFERVKQSDRLTLHDIYIPEILLRTELVTLPLLKTHNKSIITGAIKNQWGCLQTLRHNFHPVLSKALVDVNSYVQPRFAVMDGTVGLEGNGPKSGISKEMNVVLASGNIVGLDSTAARLMEFDPESIEHLRLCAENGFGSIQVDVIGERVRDNAKQFIPAHHNAVSFIEMALRASFLSWLVFKTPVFKLMCWGARRYYDLWDNFIGRNQRKRFFSQSKYSAQWE